MSLRRKLLLVALCTLALPLAGWLYVRQMEVLLRQGQEQALIAAARALTRGLTIGDEVRLRAGPGWYVLDANTPIIVDGYADDWASLTPWTQMAPGHAGVLLAREQGRLYVLVRVNDTTRTRADADDPAARNSDHVALSLGIGPRTCEYLLASGAPGYFSAPVGESTAGCPGVLNGEWQEDGSGYRVELRLPDVRGLSALGLSAYDASGRSSRNGTPPLRQLIARTPSLARLLAQLAPAHSRVRLYSAHAWLLAESGGLRLAGDAQDASGWLSALIYRGLIAPGGQGSAALRRDSPRMDAPEVKRALEGHPTTSWRDGRVRGSVVLAAAVPVMVDGEVRGALLLEQASRTVPLLANRALLALLLTSFAVLLLAGGILLAFAARLSLRIGRLRDAAERAQRRDGRPGAGPFPLLDDADEFGDLARSFARLLEAVGGYTEYLHALASRLSHELRTPLAIVTSSLENLQHARLSPEADQYVQRARDGAERMGVIVRAMSEASRIERAIAAAEAEDFDLAQVVRGCADAYRELVQPRRLECRLPDALPMHGAPELIAQALDKLIDNARSFTPDNGWIRISLHALDEGAVIEVANAESSLPEAMEGRLFDSLVSVRQASASNGTPHLGFGLYVVRLIAERHGGGVSARNLEDGGGVAFRVRLRDMLRERMVRG